MAINFDPVLKEQRSEFLSYQQTKAQAIAVLLPKLSATGSLVSNHKPTYANNFYVSGQQVLFNLQAFTNVSAANANVNAAKYTFMFQQQDMIRRLVEAYLTVVLQKRLSVIALQEIATAKDQMTAVRERYNVRHATATDLERVRALYDTSRSNYITSKIQYNRSKDELSKMTGVNYRSISSIKKKFPLLRPSPDNQNYWLNRASKQNLQIIASEVRVIAARRSLRATKSGFLPTINAVGTYYPEAEPTIEGKKEHFFYGINLNFDALQGGAIISNIRQSKAILESTEALKDQQMLATMNAVNNSFYAIVQGNAQLQAERRAVASNTKALKYVRSGYKNGTQTLLDVLDQQNKLFQSQRQYASSQINYIINRVTLRWAAAELQPGYLSQLQQWLT